MSTSLHRPAPEHEGAGIPRATAPSGSGKGARGPVLPIILFALAVVVSAVPALNVALPSLAEQTHATMSQLQWVVDAYALVFAALLLPAGAIGDRYGRKRVLVGGLTIFALGAAGAALTTTPNVLIGFRGVMGLGAALVMPSTLSIITTSMPAERRTKAVAAWVGVAGAGAIVGLVAAGVLLEFWGWASVFWLYAAAAALIGLAALRLIPNSTLTNPPRVDYVGGLLSILALSGVVYGAIEGPERGWGDTATLSAFAIGAMATIAWIAWGLLAKQPLLDPRLFARRGFSTGVASIALQFFVFFGLVFVIVQYLQLVLDYTPLRAGLALLPMGMAIGAVSRRVPHLSARAGRRPLALAGLGLMAIGMAVLSTLDPHSSYWLVLGGILPIGVGMALAMAPATTDIVAAVPAHKQGVASATNDAAREVGGTLGIAVLGSILNDQYRAGVAAAAPDSAPSELVDTAQQSLAAALGLASHLGERAGGLADGARGAFVAGLSNAFVLSAGLLLVGAIVCAALIPGRDQEDETTSSPAGSRRPSRRSPRRPLILILLGGLVLSGAYFASRPGDSSASVGGATDGSFAAVDRFVKSEMAAQRVPGLALGIVRDGRIVHQRGFGEADSSGRAVSPQTPFIIGSLSKSFTALAIMQLVEAHRVDLDEPVQRYLPWFHVADEQASKRITVRHLLNHTSGLSPKTGKSFQGNGDTSDMALERAVRKLRSAQLTTPVGTTFQYSTINDAVLGLIVQQVSGQTYEQYVQQHIFDPLAMHHSFTSEADAKRQGLAIGHHYWFGRPAPANLPYNRGILPAGYLISSAEDLAHYVMAQLDDGRYDGRPVLSAAGTAELQHPAVPTPAADTDYGMGWFVGPVNGIPAVFHQGETFNYHANIVMMPKSREGVVVLMNAENSVDLFTSGRMGSIATGVASLLAGRQPPAPPSRAPLFIVYSFLFALVSVQAAGMTRAVRRLRSRRLPTGRWGRRSRTGLALATNLGWALLVLVLLPKQFGVPLLTLAQGLPDLAYLLLVSGVVALGWAVIRTAWTQVAFRTR